jgi:hypothetical protein
MDKSESASNKFEPPEWTAGLYPGAMDALTGLVNRPYSQYQGMRNAPMNDRQFGAGEMLTDKALYGDPQSNAARGSLMSISQGGARNPYGDAANPFVGAQNAFGGTSNPYIGQQNRFLDNQYLNQNIADTANDMASAHALGNASTNNMLAAQAGAFGGSAHLEKQAMDAAGLAKQVGQMGTAARSADLGRMTSTEANDLARNTGAAATDLQRLTSASSDDLGRNLGGWFNDMTRRGNVHQQDVGNIMGASGMAPAFSQMDHQDINALMGFGDKEQNYMQGLLNSQVDEFNRQQDYPLKQFDLLMRGLGSGSGQYYQQTQSQPGQSGVMNGIGGAMGLAGLLGLGN